MKEKNGMEVEEELAIPYNTQKLESNNKTNYKKYKEVKKWELQITVFRS